MLNISLTSFWNNSCWYLCFEEFKGEKKMKRTSVIFFGLFFLVFSGLLLSQSFTLITPNGGENWNIGDTYDITWNSNQIPGNIILKLKKGNTLLGSIAWNIPNTGTYSWTINDIQGSPIEPGNDYKVIVRSKDDISIEDVSNANFTINPAPTSCSIQVTKPNGGEEWNKGSSYNVNWDMSGNCGNVIIQLIQGGSPTGAIYNGVNSGSFNWKIDKYLNNSEIQAGDYKLQVKSLNNPSIKDLSNSTFTINALSIDLGDYWPDSITLSLKDLINEIILTRNPLLRRKFRFPNSYTYYLNIKEVIEKITRNANEKFNPYRLPDIYPVEIILFDRFSRKMKSIAIIRDLTWHTVPNPFSSGQGERKVSLNIDWKMNMSSYGNLIFKERMTFLMKMQGGKLGFKNISNGNIIRKFNIKVKK